MKFTCYAEGTFSLKERKSKQNKKRNDDNKNIENNNMKQKVLGSVIFSNIWVNIQPFVLTKYIMTFYLAYDITVGATIIRTATVFPCKLVMQD